MISPRPNDLRNGSLRKRATKGNFNLPNTCKTILIWSSRCGRKTPSTAINRRQQRQIPFSTRYVDLTQPLIPRGTRTAQPLIYETVVRDSCYTRDSDCDAKAEEVPQSSPTTMQNYELIEQPCQSANGTAPLFLFGKTIVLAPLADHWRIVRHRDYPMLTDQDVHRFSEQALRGNKVVMSGCPVDIHPYRLVEIETGTARYLLDIPQRVRGNRQSYPPVFRFVPALLAIPPGQTLRTGFDPAAMAMHVMETEKLLDSAILYESLLIKTLVTP